MVGCPMAHCALAGVPPRTRRFRLGEIGAQGPLPGRGGELPDTATAHESVAYAKPEGSRAQVKAVSSQGRWNTFERWPVSRRRATQKARREISPIRSWGTVRRTW